MCHDVWLCTEIVSCEKMVATKSQKFIYPHAMVLRYRGNKKAKHSESLDSPIPSEPPKNERNKGTNEEETAEVEMTFCAPSEEVRCEMNLYACRCD
jgi:hypothetical protein